MKVYAKSVIFAIFLYQILRFWRIIIHFDFPKNCLNCDISMF